MSTTEQNIPEQDLNQFEAALLDPQNDSPKGALWKAWHYLQVYSTWAVRMPSSVADLQNYLQIPAESLASYTFFPSMQEAYATINNGASKFLTETFPRVIKLGNSLRSFAEENKGGSDSIWEAIKEMVADKESRPDVLELINDLQTRARDNVKEADEISVLLSSYSTELIKGDGKLKLVGENLDKDVKTSKETIELLQGDTDVMGSIAQIRELADTNQENYDSAVVKAATSVTYAWIIPIGTIAAAVVAGIYGKAATDSLDAYKAAMKQLEEGEKELLIAINAQSVQSLASSSVSNTRKHTEVAIQQVTIVKNAWANLAANLEIVRLKVTSMTKTVDENEVLQSAFMIKRYAGQASKAWDKLWPAIVELTDEPYIVVEQEEKTIDGLKAEIELNLANPATSN